MTPGDHQLAAVIAGLFRASRSDGRQRAHTLGSGLKIVASTKNGDVLAITRGDEQTDFAEAAVVAREAGWIYCDVEREDIGPHSYIVIRPSALPPDDDVPLYHEATAAPQVDPDDPDPPDTVIIALLDAPGPWQEALTLRTAEGRAAYFQTAKRCQLRDLYAWALGKYPAQVRAWLAQNVNPAPSTPETR